MLLTVFVAAVPARGQAVYADTASLGQGAYARACMLMERTIFRVDVLTLELRLDPATAERIRRLVTAGAGRDSIASVALRSQDAFVRVRFVRDVGLDRFIASVRGDLQKVHEAGHVDRRTGRAVSDSLPLWYGFLEARGVKEGDQLLYRIRGDTLVSAYRATDGHRLLQQTDIGPQRRLAVLGSYLVRGSSFRPEILDALLSERGGC